MLSSTTALFCGTRASALTGEVGFVAGRRAISFPSPTLTETDVVVAFCALEDFSGDGGSVVVGDVDGFVFTESHVSTVSVFIVSIGSALRDFPSRATTTTGSSGLVVRYVSSSFATESSEPLPFEPLDIGRRSAALLFAIEPREEDADPWSSSSRRSETTILSRVTSNSVTSDTNVAPTTTVSTTLFYRQKKLTRNRVALLLLQT